jgi:protein-tyrosine-phosphatase
MGSDKRRFTLTIWWLALGYFVFYVPYLGSIKATVGGLWPGVGAGVSGFRLLPAVVISTAVVLPVIVTLMGWWKYAGRRRVFGLGVPFPRPLVFLSGLGTAIIIGATTLIFTFNGVSIVFALVLMRGGVLIMGPVVDRLFGRRVRWFAWAAFSVTVPAILIALADVNNYSLSALTAAIIVAYLAGYLLRIPCATWLAKSRDEATTYRYFVEEQLVAVVFLVAMPAAFALVGGGEIASELRQGFTGFFTSGTTLPALVIGALYACLYFFGTLIYLDCRENTYCIPLNRGSSLLAGLFASYVLTLFFGLTPPSGAQVFGAGLLVVALLLLSPLHHRLEDALDKLRPSLAALSLRLRGFAAGPRPFGATTMMAKVVTANQPGASDEVNVSDQQPRRRLFLFVCSGNTCRSPMAAAIANAEIAARLGVPLESLDTVGARATSAGVTARVGAPMTDAAQRTLSSLDVPAPPHAARNLTEELALEAEMIFCLTRAHHRAVVEMFPSVAAKTHCLDPDGDIDDPIGRGPEVYLSCAERIRALVRWRLDEAQLSASF